MAGRGGEMKFKKRSREVPAVVHEANRSLTPGWNQQRPERSDGWKAYAAMRASSQVTPQGQNVPWNPNPDQRPWNLNGGYSTNPGQQPLPDPNTDYDSFNSEVQRRGNIPQSSMFEPYPYPGAEIQSSRGSTHLMNLAVPERVSRNLGQHGVSQQDPNYAIRAIDEYRKQKKLLDAYAAQQVASTPGRLQSALQGRR